MRIRDFIGQAGVLAAFPACAMAEPPQAHALKVRTDFSARLDPDLPARVADPSAPTFAMSKGSQFRYRLNDRLDLVAGKGGLSPVSGKTRLQGAQVPPPVGGFRVGVLVRW